MRDEELIANLFPGAFAKELDEAATLKNKEKNKTALATRNVDNLVFKWKDDDAALAALT